MTGVNELRSVQLVSAAPDQIRVSVRAQRTQLDVALPADVSVAAFLPELARLVGSHDSHRDEDLADRNERRTVWVLTRVAGNKTMPPDQTLRDGGVNNGELLRISAHRALSAPTLYDDVVDAVARLNRAAYAAWNATAAGAMTFAAVWLCTAVWVFFLLTHALAEHRGAVLAGAGLTTAAMVIGGALAHRALGLADVATAVGWPAIALSAALGWVTAASYGEYGRAAACAVLLAFTAVYFRFIGTGHSAFIAAAVVFAFGGLGLLARASGGRVEVVAAIATVTAALGCVAVPALTTRLGRFPTPTVNVAATGKQPSANPFTPTVDETDSGAAMPSAEAVWAKVRAAMHSRAGLLAGLAAVIAGGATVLQNAHPGWPSAAFGLGCAVMLAAGSRRVHTVLERIAMAAPALALTLIVCLLAQAGSAPQRLAGIGVLAVIAVLAPLASLTVTGGRLSRWLPTVAAYIDYAAMTALIPLALWPLGVYDQLGLW